MEREEQELGDSASSGKSRTGWRACQHRTEEVERAGDRAKRSGKGRTLKEEGGGGGG